MTTEQLGEIRREFKPGLANLVAGVFITLLMSGIGGAALYLSISAVIESGGDLPVSLEEGKKGWDWEGVAITGALGVGLLIGGMLLLRWIRSLSSFRVRIGESGFAVTDKGVPRVIGWDDIVAVQETRLYERPPILKGVAKYALPKVMSKSFIVTVRSGEPVAFDGNKINGHISLAEMIKEQTDPRAIPWEVREQRR